LAHGNDALEGVVIAHRFAASAEVADSIQADEHRHASDGKPQAQEQVSDLEARDVLRLIANQDEVVLADVARIEVEGIEVPVGSGGFEAKPAGVAQPPIDLPDADPRLVVIALRTVEAGARDRPRRGAGGLSPADGGAGSLNVAVPKPLARDARHAERSGVDAESGRRGFDVVALDRRAPRVVVVEVAQVVRVVVRAEVADRSHTDQKAIADFQIELGPELEAPSLDVGADAQVVNAVVACEKIPLEKKLRLLGRLLEILGLLSRGSCRKQQCRDDQEAWICKL